MEGKKTYHVDAIDPELLEGGVRGGVVGEAQEGEVCGLHGCVWLGVAEGADGDG